MLTRTVEHTTNLQSKLFSEATQVMVAKVGALPSLPTTLAAVRALVPELQRDGITFVFASDLVH